jgi:aminoglycoside 2''-phosphotransferase
MQRSSHDLGSLVSRIRAAFPDLVFGEARLAAAGEDHDAVLLDQAWVFRFPRTPQQLAWFPGEVRLTQALAGRLPIAAPDYRLVAHDDSFGGYPMIHGAPMRLADFVRAPRPVQERLVDDVAGLLCVLHSLPPALLALPDGPRTNRSWAAQAASYYREHCRRRLAEHLEPVFLDRLDGFHAAYLERPWPSEKIIHGDLREAHLFLDADLRLTGVIDFGDAVVGDPAYDFTWFWMLGDWAPAHALARYGDPDPGLLERSRWSFARYATGRLALAVSGDSRYSPDALRASLDRHLSSLGFA